VIGTEVLELRESGEVLTSSEFGVQTFDFSESNITGGREPFTLQLVGLEANLSTTVHVLHGSVLGKNRIVSQDGDVVEVGTGDNTRQVVEFDEEVVDDKGEEDGTSNSALTGTSFGGDDAVGRIVDGVGTDDEQVRVTRIGQVEDRLERLA
jgi:hypothetical protein